MSPRANSMGQNFHPDYDNASPGSPSETGTHEADLRETLLLEAI